MSDLDYKVWMITSVLDVEFNGTCDLDKLAFIDKYWDARQKAMSKMLDAAFREMVGVKQCRSV